MPPTPYTYRSRDGASSAPNLSRDFPHITSLSPLPAPKHLAPPSPYPGADPSPHHLYGLGLGLGLGLEPDPTPSPKQPPPPLPPRHPPSPLAHVVHLSESPSGEDDTNPFDRPPHHQGHSLLSPTDHPPHRSHSTGDFTPEASSHQDSGASTASSSSTLAPLPSCLIFPTYATCDGDDAHWKVRVHGWAYTPASIQTRKERFAIKAFRLYTGISSSDTDASSLLTARASLFFVKDIRAQQAHLDCVGLALSRWAQTDASPLPLPTDSTATLHPPSPDEVEGGEALGQLQDPSGDATIATRNGHFTSTLIVESDVVDRWLHDLPHDSPLPAKDRPRVALRIRASLLRPSGPPLPPVYGLVRPILPHGISIISDIDDTIKDTGVIQGKKVVLSNTFTAEAKAVPGMASLYDQWWRAGAEFHYVSNSPWQLYPLIEEFFALNHFPPGSIHLRLLTGMFQGRYDPIQGKRDAIIQIFKDFPHRLFILIGDSGELDMEMYSALADEFPGRIVRILIRDVTRSYLMHQLPPTYLPDCLSSRSRSPSAGSSPRAANIPNSLRTLRSRSHDGLATQIRQKLVQFSERIQRVLGPHDADLFRDGHDLVSDKKILEALSRFPPSR